MGSNFRTSNGIDPKTGLARRVHGNMADLNDFMHGWLNYQIEHHAFPQLSMLSYQKSAPQMRALRKAQRAVRAAQRLQASQEDRGRHGGPQIDAPLRPLVGVREGPLHMGRPEDGQGRKGDRLARQRRLLRLTTDD